MLVQTLLVVACLSGLLAPAEGHGWLMQPPSRSSMWREGFPTPPNYDDSGLNCGGFSHQWDTHGGLCGICGDPYDANPRPNEPPGKYATGIISRVYRQADVIQAKVKLTAYHKGWFEFRICPNNNPNVAATPQCLDRYLLPLANGQGTRFFPAKSVADGVSNVELKLPSDLTCTQCVFQWKYHAGNNWGVDSATGQGCVGCGPQEEFYGCADVRVDPAGNQQSTSASASATSTTTPATTPRASTGGSGGGGVDYSKCKAAGAWVGQASMDSWCQTNCPLGNCPVSHCTCPAITPTTTTTYTPTSTSSTTTTPPSTTTTTTTTTPATQKSSTKTTTTPSSTTSTTTPTITTKRTTSTTTASTSGSGGGGVDYSKCTAAGAWAGQAGLDSWCQTNCPLGYCPATHCTCQPDGSQSSGPRCKPVGIWASVNGMVGWCVSNCSRGYCPPSYCSCA